MAYNNAPSSFFGAGYSFASSALTLKSNAATGVTVGTTFQGEADDNVLTTAAAHGLLTGDRVRVTEGTTLPTGLSAATDYYVKTTPTTTTLTLSATNGGAVIDLTADGTADNTLQSMGPLNEVTDAEGHATTGDWRKLIYGIMEMLYQKWINTPTADRPAKVNITRSSSVNETTGAITRFYTVTCTTNPTGLEVVDE